MNIIMLVIVKGEFWTPNHRIIQEKTKRKKKKVSLEQMTREQSHFHLAMRHRPTG